jgi:NAD(P)-dependent dehydrogenase (short-subunit alcohol dehydrogenase family)
MTSDENDFGFAAQRVDGRKRVAVITGANAGLGFETARVLLAKGMRVVVACRSPERGHAAVAELLAKTADRNDAAVDDAVFAELDVSSLGSVRAFAQRIVAANTPIHVLVCNAGIMMGPRRTSVDGVELQLATNYLGHFELCRLLQDRLIASAPARIVHVSSLAARFASIEPDRLNRGDDDYSSRSVYGMTKLAQVVFSRELNRRLQGTGVTSNSLEPGVVATNLSKGVTDDPAMRKRLEQGVSVEEGARTQIFLAASVKVDGKGGGNWVDCEDVSTGPGKLRYVASAHSLRASMDEALWAASEALIEKHAPR